VGVGLDGFPHHLAVKLMDEGRMPNLKRLTAKGAFKRIDSIYPTVSGVAWSAFQTGKNPGEFGVFGFVELKPDFDLFIPNATHLRAETIWYRLSRENRRVVALSVPMTYPAPKVNGLLVSGFLAPSLDERAVSSPEVLGKLRKTGYEIDINPAVAAESAEALRTDLARVSEARWRTALRLMDSEKWDLFFIHVMDTDRINHFMWKHQYEPQSDEGRFFLDFYHKIDGFLGQLAEKAGKKAEILILSDHGFCSLNWEVQLNRWLRNEGYLDYENDPQRVFKAVKEGSKALALVPGRIYILREGKWDRGTVRSNDYEALRDDIIQGLREMKHPESGEAVCKQVMRKEDVFTGMHVAAAPDIILDPNDGYDLQARLGSGDVFERPRRSGMHTYQDALLAATEGLDAIARAGSIQEAGRLLGEHFL